MNEDVKKAMLTVDRGNYCGPHDPYGDCPQSIGYNVTISAPHMHAMCLDLLKDYLKPGCRALDVGSGSGYLTACMAVMCGQAHGIEYIPELVPISIANVKKDGKSDLLDGKTLTFQHGDGSKGLPSFGPYDSIHVGAAAPQLPEALVEQLAAPGRMIVPVGPQWGAQELVVVDKDAAGNVTQRTECGVRYVPLHM
jgi:protein-L-isoaspartate(D-aspartate) O-methyltransferase